MFLLIVVTVQFVSGANVTEGSNFTICLEKSVTTAVEFQVFISSRDGTARNGRGECESLSLSLSQASFQILAMSPTIKKCSRVPPIPNH